MYEYYVRKLNMVENLILFWITYIRAGAESLTQHSHLQKSKMQKKLGTSLFD